MLLLCNMKAFDQYNSHIIFTQYLQNVLDHFAACFGIRIAFFDLYGKELKVGMKQGMCKFCKYIRNEPDMNKACFECDKKWMDKAAKTKKLVSYHCHAGMCEMIKPVYMHETLIGYVMIGQFRDSDRPSSKICSLFDDKELCEKFSQAPYYPPSKIEHITGIFEVLVDSTIDKQAYKLELEEPMFKLKNYLFQNISRNVTVQEAASYLNWSKSKLTHSVKNKIGQSFKQLQLEIKLAFAEKLITTQHMTIAEAASKAGFDDPCYFSRIYKKYRGKSPSKLRT